MTIKNSGASLGMNEINAEFSRGNNVNAYRGTGWFTDAGATGNFSSGALPYSDFYGKRLTSPVSTGTTDFTWNGTGFPQSRSFTVPNYNTIQVIVEGSDGPSSGFGCDFNDYAGGQGGRSSYTKTLAGGGPTVGSTISILNGTNDGFYGMIAARATSTGKFDMVAGDGFAGTPSHNESSGGRGGGTVCVAGGGGSPGWHSGGDTASGTGGNTRGVSPNNVRIIIS